MVRVNKSGGDRIVEGWNSKGGLVERVWFGFVMDGQTVNVNQRRLAGACEV